jgi:hypothetical protein
MDDTLYGMDIFFMFIYKYVFIYIYKIILFFSVYRQKSFSHLKTKGVHIFVQKNQWEYVIKIRTGALKFVQDINTQISWVS